MGMPPLYIHSDFLYTFPTRRVLKALIYMHRKMAENRLLLTSEEVNYDEQISFN